ncbi:unnamed protein product [Periconia digitata]|uniref:Uncharacterized protein n=1 Tax=Periconia digitata TaxID=1303443 RepID=A0A9W4UP72_9PLEO|nr:unnamed protein product [Periconia digitata]
MHKRIWSRRVRSRVLFVELPSTFLSSDLIRPLLLCICWRQPTTKDTGGNFLGVCLCVKVLF